MKKLSLLKKAISILASAVIISVSALALGTLAFIIQPTQLVLADSVNLFWVGGTGNWSDTAHWSTSSGGAGSHAAPLSTNNVSFDANSFNGTGQVVTVDGTGSCQQMIWTGVTNVPTLAGSAQLNVYGDATFIAPASMTITYTGILAIRNTSGTATITSNGQSLYRLTISGVGGTMSLADNLTLTNAFQLTSGVFTTNSQNMTVLTCSITAATTRTFNISSSTVSCATWTATTTTGLTFTTDSSSKIIVTGDTNFNGGGLIYPTVEFSNIGLATIIDSNNFTSLIIDQTISNKSFKFTDGSTQTVTSFSVPITGTSIVTLRGTASGGWAITKAGGGTITLDYVNVSYSTGSPASTWYARNQHSINGGNNSGWTFQWYGKINGVVNPAKVSGIAVTGIKLISGE